MDNTLKYVLPLALLAHGPSCLLDSSYWSGSDKDSFRHLFTGTALKPTGKEIIRYHTQTIVTHKLG